jgi:hypothetical protein
LVPVPGVGAGVLTPTGNMATWIDQLVLGRFHHGENTWFVSYLVNAPTKLGGTSVTIGGAAGFVDYISPLQVNVQVPGGVGAGTQSLVVTTAAGASAPFYGHRGCYPTRIAGSVQL